MADDQEIEIFDPFAFAEQVHQPTPAAELTSRELVSLKDAKLHELMDSAMTKSDWVNLFKQLYVLAMDGNMKAHNLLISYRFGNAPEFIHVQGDHRSEVIVRIEGMTKEEVELASR